jgi:hypothetical protein
MEKWEKWIKASLDAFWYFYQGEPGMLLMAQGRQIFLSIARWPPLPLCGDDILKKGISKKNISILGNIGNFTSADVSHGSRNASFLVHGHN